MNVSILFLIFFSVIFFLSFTALTQFETQNKYKIVNIMGQQIYFAAEGKI